MTQTSTVPRSRAQDEALAALQRLGSFDADVVPFVAENLALLPLLREASARVRAVLGEVPVHSELYRDPEEGWQKLFLVIASPFGTQETLEREERLGDQWVLDHVPAFGHLVSFTASTR